MELRAQFREIIKSDYLEEENLVPGVYALRAYDSIMAISHAVTKLGSDENTTAKTLLEGILSSKFLGLSGNISFMELRAQFREIIKSDYLEENLVPGVYALRAYDSIMAISHAVTKLGSDENTTAKTLLEGILSSKFLGLSGNISFRDGILLDSSNLRIINVVGKVYKDLGFWSSKVLKKNYYLPYEFIPFYGTYDDLVLSVSNETFDDAVGDVTIIESRAKLVEFTQPFAESGLSMMVQYKHKPTRAWLFLKPFSPSMWLATIGILFYTMFIVWFFERESNPDFKGPCHDQLGTTMWFTFSSLFFAHKTLEMKDRRGKSLESFFDISFPFRQTSEEHSS